VPDSTTNTATTEVPKQEGGFPPFDTTTFPSQFFWLAVTFAFLFVVLWKVSGPRIKGAIGLRRTAINSAIAAADKARADADAASTAYDMALTSARARAHSLAEETRQKINAEIASAKAEGEAQAASAMAAADARIASTYNAAKAHIAEAAQSAAIAIVEKLTGETVTQADAANAMGN
jgi:F-type H+-transporting ATPase subunit b